MASKALKRIICTFAAVGVITLSGCESRSESFESSIAHDTPDVSSEQSAGQNKPTGEKTETANMEIRNDETNIIYIEVGESTLTAVLENNKTADALKELLADAPLTISAENYGGFEKVCSLGKELPRNDSQTTAHAGDICLYNGDRLVIFYGSNSWSYTRIGKVSNADISELEKALSGDEAQITLSLKTP